MTGADRPAGPFVAFKRHVRAESVPGEAVFVWSDKDVTAVRGAGVETLVSLLDGSRTLPQLLREAAAAMPVAEAGRLVRRLAEANLVGYRSDGRRAEDAGAEGRSAEAYWDRAGLEGAAAQERVRSTPVSLITVGDVDADEAHAVCRAAGLDTVGADVDAPFALVLCEDYLHPRLRSLAARLRGRGRPWLLARPYGAEPWTGPVFTPAGHGDGCPTADPAHGDGGPAGGPAQGGGGPAHGPARAAGGHGTHRSPGHTAGDAPGDRIDGFVVDPGPCWGCLAHRLRAHRRAELEVERVLGLDGPVPRPAPSLSAVRTLGLHSAALEASKWLAGLRVPEQRAVCVLDSLTLRTTHHPVTRRPQCPDCGDPGLVAARTRRPVVLVSRPKAAGGGSNDRALSAEAMLERHAHLVGPLTGIVTGIRPVAGLPEGLYAYDSGHNLALRAHSSEGVRRVLRARSGGKGATEVEARASALCEAVERYCAARQGDEPTVRDTWAGLGARAVHPNDCQLFHERQYAMRDRWNATHGPFHQVARPFDTSAPTDWTPLWSLTGHTRRLLPTSTLYFETSPGGAPDGLWADSNGNAAGSSLEDAVVQGFLELVERDAVAVWWYNRLRVPALDLDAFDEPWLAGLRDAFGRAGRTLAALDLTTDLGVPAVAAVSMPEGDGQPDFVCGFGAHLDPRLALRRAVTEAAQLLPSPQPMPGGTLLSQPQLLPDRGESARRPGDWPAHRRREDLLADVEHITALVARHGMELLVLDQTRPDVGIPVVKVVVPGLRPFYARFAPGRLYDVPVRTGHRSRPAAFEELNPVPLPV
ncbi:TOMM precursor leader peptide-binding protein [Streptomyces anandii]|uniref:TOMM precursor leader peptide-binding protein n=1 Tax=Streptomyces anandii TaxID=285454 RepID=UPI00379A110B